MYRLIKLVQMVAGCVAPRRLCVGVYINCVPRTKVFVVNIAGDWTGHQIVQQLQPCTYRFNLLGLYVIMIRLWHLRDQYLGM